MQINDVARTEAQRSGRFSAAESWTKVVPGEGDLPLAELMGALPPGIPVSLEVSGPAPGKRDAARYARRACAATRAVAFTARR